MKAGALALFASIIEVSVVGMAERAPTGRHETPCAPEVREDTRR